MNKHSNVWACWGAFSFKLPHQTNPDLLICLPQALKSSSVKLLSPHSFTVPGYLWFSLVLGRCPMPIPEGESRERVYMHLLKGVLMPILSLSPEPMDNYLSRRQIAWVLKPCGPHYCDLRINLTANQ